MYKHRFHDVVPKASFHHRPVRFGTRKHCSARAKGHQDDLGTTCVLSKWMSTNFRSQVGTWPWYVCLPLPCRMPYRNLWHYGGHAPQLETRWSVLFPTFCTHVETQAFSKVHLGPMSRPLIPCKTKIQCALVSGGHSCCWCYYHHHYPQYGIQVAARAIDTRHGIYLQHWVRCSPS